MKIRVNSCAVMITRICWMIFWILKLETPCLAGLDDYANTFTLYSGGKASSANYSDEATLGDIVGVSAAPAAGVTLKSGFIGQLYEVESLAVGAQPAVVAEGGTSQLSAVATMDDDSLVRLGGSDAQWSVLDGPLTGISPGGLATAGRVFVNAPATVRGTWLDVHGDVTLTVLNVNSAMPAETAPDPGFSAQPFSTLHPGLFEGLLRDAQGNIIGALTGFKLTGKRSFTARVVFNGVVQTLRGTLLPDGSFSLNYPRRNRSDLAVTLQLGTSDSGAVLMRATIEGDGVATEGWLAQAPFGAKNPAPAELVGSFTFLLPAPGTGSRALPEGDGYGTARIAKTGIITAAGRTGDGIGFTLKGLLSGDLQWHVFKELHRRQGQLAGIVTFRDVPGVSDFDGSMLWSKNPLPSSKSYPGGFSLNPGLIGSAYTAPAKGGRALDSLPEGPENARLTLAASSLPGGGFSRLMTWHGTNKPTHAGPETLSVWVAPSNGALTGRFHDRAGKLLVLFRGVIFQKQGLAGGCFLRDHQTGYVLIRANDAE